MEELVVLEKLSEINLAIQMVAQWTVNGDSGHLGDPALSPAVEELNFPQE